MQASRELVAIGLFQDASRAGDALNALKQAGFAASDISLFVSSNEQLATQEGANTHGARSLVAGAVLGGLGGWLAGIRALAIPLVGPFIAAGAAALGAGIGTVLFGMAATSRSPDSRKLSRGDAVVVVRAGTRLPETDRILRDHGASFVEHAREESIIGAATPATAAP